jgi:hypothetical protein
VICLLKLVTLSLGGAVLSIQRRPNRGIHLLNSLSFNNSSGNCSSFFVQQGKEGEFDGVQQNLTSKLKNVGFPMAPKNEEETATETPKEELSVKIAVNLMNFFVAISCSSVSVHRFGPYSYNGSPRNISLRY